MDKKSVHDKQREFLFPCVANYYEDPVVLVEGKGVRVKDIDGREYLDLFGGILTVSVEHCNEEIASAIATQARTLGHVSTLYQTTGMVEVAEKLAELAPGGLRKSFFTNSGTEADETAVMLAKVKTGSSEIIALRHGYSGRSQLATNLTGHSKWRVLASSIAGIKHAVAPYCYRCPLGLTYPSCEVKCATDLKELIETTTSGKPAAFLAEPILGVGGFIEPPPEYFEIAVGIVRSYGGLFICDEVQTGFGRTGDHWWGIDHYGVVPDIMTMAKGIANGAPVGVTMATPEIADAFAGPSLSTFGGNPITMAATRATLAIMQRENIPKRSGERGRQLREGLLALQAKYPIIGQVQGKGLMQGIELVEDRTTKAPATARTGQFLEAAKAEGLLVGRGGLYGNRLRLAPPMLISKDDIEQALGMLDRAFARVQG